LFLLPIAAAFAVTAYAAGISATATITDSQISPGVYDYSVTLNNTGTTTIGTFWFGWIPGAGFLSAAPTDVISPTGWNDRLTNANSAIQWTTATDLLAPGDSLSGFSFDSTETPNQLLAAFPGPGLGTGDPETTSFVYIAAPLADPGDQFAATISEVSDTTEPATFPLLLTGLALVAIAFKYRHLHRT
jgi:hypothetical protein